MPGPHAFEEFGTLKLTHMANVHPGMVFIQNVVVFRPQQAHHIIVNQNACVRAGGA